MYPYYVKIPVIRIPLIRRLLYHVKRLDSKDSHNICKRFRLKFEISHNICTKCLNICTTSLKIIIVRSQKNRLIKRFAVLTRIDAVRPTLTHTYSEWKFLPSDHNEREYSPTKNRKFHLVQIGNSSTNRQREPKHSLTDHDAKGPLRKKTKGPFFL